MTKEDGYILEQQEYPEKGKRVANLIGVMERDHEGWLWPIKDSNTNPINRNKKTVTLRYIIEEGGNYKSIRGEGSKAGASPSKLPANKGRCRRTCPGLGSPTLKKRRRRNFWGEANVKVMDMYELQREE